MKVIGEIHANGFIHTDISKDEQIEPQFRSDCLDVRNQVLVLIELAQENLLQAKTDVISRPIESWSQDNQSLSTALQSVDDASYKSRLLYKRIVEAEKERRDNNDS